MAIILSEVAVEEVSLCECCGTYVKLYVFIVVVVFNVLCHELVKQLTKNN